MNDIESRIRQHAYQLWQKHGCPEGRDEEFWRQAKAKELGLMQPAEVDKTNDPAKSAGF
jgi:hypothetical protein